MPWSIRQRSGKYCVFKEGEDSPITCHDTRREATAHLRALYAHEPKGLAEVEVKEIRAQAELKEDAPDGTLRAVFSSFDVVDSDGDVVLATAFKDGQQVPLCWAHDWTKPVGKGVIRVEGNRAVFDGAFNLKTTWGRDAYESVKDMSNAGIQEYSWGFRVPQGGSEYGEKDGQRVRFIKQADVYEVSPVLVGANRQTTTLAIKEQKFIGDAIEDSYEDRISELNDLLRARMNGPFSSGGYSYVVATFDDYCVACICDDYEDDRKYYRIPYTLDDMGDPVLGEPVEVRPDFVPVKESTYADQAQKLLADGRAFLDRTKALVALRREQRKSGRVLSQTNRDRLSAHPGALRQVADDIDTLLNETMPPEKGADPPDTLRLFVEYQRLRAGQMGRLFDGVRNAHTN